MRINMKKFILASLLLSAAFLTAGSAYAATIYFPHVDTSLPWQTEIAIINTSDQTVTGTLRGLSDAGQLVETKPVTLSGHGRRQIVVANEFTNHIDIGYIVFDASSDTVQGYTKFYQAGIYRAAIPAVKEVNTSDIFISHIDSSADWWTGISLVNTTSSAKVLTITFNNGQSRQITISANGHMPLTIESLFNNQPQPDIQSAVITNASGIIGLELFGNVGGSNHLDGLLLTDNTTSTIYYPHVASDNVWWTGIVAYNPSELACSITITPYSVQGTLLSSSTVPLPGKGKFIGAVAQLGLPDQTAWFKIDSTIPITGFELFGTLDGNLLAANAEGGRTGAKTGVFAKIEKDGWTGIAFVNTEATAASVTLTAYDDNGTVVATQVLPVGGHAKVVNLAEAIFSQNISSATYITYSSDRNVVGFQLNGSSDGTMLDGLPALADTAPTVDTTPPIVSAVGPANGATSVPTTATVSVAFNEAMNASTVNAATFTVTAGGTPVAGAISSSVTTYTFTPAANLAAGTLYTVTVTTGVTDLAGNAMAANFTSTFTTAAAVDTTPPVVSVVSPANGATNVPATATVSVTFNEAMNVSTINAATFTVSAGGTPVAGAISSSSGTTYTFTPAANLAAGTIYTVTVTTGVTDVAGNAMAANFTSTFTTSAAGPATVDVSIVDFAFSPATITINVGDTVRWTNTGSAVHTSTSGTSPTADGKWSSGILSTGQTFSFTFTQAGTYPYFCQVHTFMTATVIVH